MPILNRPELSSLQKLQSLDKDYDGFATQLIKLAELIGISLDTSAAATPVKTANGRLDWAVRWLLNKLRASSEEGLQARSSAQAWILLSNIFERLQPFLTARALVSNKFLSTLEEAAKDAWTKHQDVCNSSELHYRPMGQHSSENDVSIVGNHEGQSDKSSKKRKRGKDADPSSALKKRRTIDNEKHSTFRPPFSSSQPTLDLFRSFNYCLHRLVALASEDGNMLDIYSRQYLKSALRTDSAQAAHLLGLWLTAETIQKNSSSLASVEENSVGSLASILYIWNHNSTPSEDIEGVTTLHFSRHCLLPAIRFLCIERQRRISGLPESTDRKTIFQVERLLAQYIFIPTKINFRESGQRKASDVTPMPGEPLSLKTLLNPVQEAFSKQTSNYEKKIALIEVASISLLFEIAMRCSSVSNLKKRIGESPWIQAVFINLATCLGLDGQEPRLDRLPAGNLEAFVALLQLAVQHKVSFKGDYVRKLATQFVQSDFSSNETLKWAVMAQLISLDANSFIPPRPVSDVDSTDGEQQLHTLILSAVTAQCWIPLEQTLEESMTDSLERSSYQTYHRYLQIKNHVVLPIMKAYVTARDVRGFLVYWQGELSHFLGKHLNEESQNTKSTRHTYSFSIWQDRDLDAELARALGNSLTTSQIIDIVNGLTAKLDFKNAESLGNLELAHLISKLHILHAVFSGLSDEVVVKSLETRIIEVLQKCIALPKSEQFGTRSIRRSAWKLLATCHHLILSFADLATIEDKNVNSEIILRQALESICSIISSIHVDEIFEVLEAIDCVGRVDNDVRERQLSLGPATQFKSELFTVLYSFFSTGQTDITTTEASYLACVLSKYPELFSPRAHEADDQKRTRLLLLEKLGLYMQNFMDVEDVNPWQHFIQGAQDKSRSWVDEISRSAVNSIQSLETSDGDKLAVVEEACLELRPTLIPRPNRQQILDGAITKLTNRKEFHNALAWSRTMSLMIRVLEAPAGSVGIMNSTDPLWNLAQALDEAVFSGRVEHENIISVLALFNELAKTVFQHHNNNHNIEQSQHYLKESWAKVNVVLANKTFLYTQPAVLGICTLTCNAVLVYNDARVAALEIKTNTPNILCSRLCSELDTQLKHILSNTDDTHTTLSPALILLGAVSNLQSPTLLDNVKIVEPTIKNWMSSVFKSEHLMNELSILPVAALVFKASCSLDASRNLLPSLPIALLLNQKRLSAYDREIIHQAFMGAVLLVDRANKEQIIKDLLVFDSGAGLNLAKMDLLHALISASKFKPHSPLISPNSVSLITTTLSEYLPQTTTYDFFHHQSAAITQLLLHHPKSQTQLAIDTTLLAITTSCSPSGPQLIKHHAPQIFTSLTRILLTLLTHHRRALRGRFDILIQALQSLLRCLFIQSSDPAINNNTKGTLTSLRQALPPWAPTTLSTALTAPHASLYTRLLITLCDPTLASVRPSSSSSSANLTDATKKARNYAGQYAPLLLMELSRCLLVGRLGGAGSVREALLPGVWAVFEVIERGVLVAAVEGMPAGRGRCLGG